MTKSVKHFRGNWKTLCIKAKIHLYSRFWRLNFIKLQILSRLFKKKKTHQTIKWLKSPMILFAHDFAGGWFGPGSGWRFWSPRLSPQWVAGWSKMAAVPCLVFNAAHCSTSPLGLLSPKKLGGNSRWSQGFKRMRTLCSLTLEFPFGSYLTIPSSLLKF